MGVGQRDTCAHSADVILGEYNPSIFTTTVPYEGVEPYYRVPAWEYNRLLTDLITLHRELNGLLVAVDDLVDDVLDIGERDRPPNS